jgi:hypothetical protein
MKTIETGVSKAMKITAFLALAAFLVWTGCENPAGGGGGGGTDTWENPVVPEPVPQYTRTAATADQLSAQYDTLENLKYRYLIGLAVEEARTAGETPAALDAADAKIRGCLDGTIKDYMEVVFSGTLVRVPDGISQYDAMQAALEQAYPREKGFWWLCTKGSQFGVWVNGMGGRLFTEGELASGRLEQPTGTEYVAGEIGDPLPQSGVIDWPRQEGNLTYKVNGFFANWGVSGWLVSHQEMFTWGPGKGYGLTPVSILHNDNGSPNARYEIKWAQAVLSEEGVTQARVDAALGDTTAKSMDEVAALLREQFPVLRPENRGWQLPAWFRENASVAALLEKCETLDENSTGVATRSAKNAYQTISGTWNLQYAQYLFRTFTPYVIAYQNLYALDTSLPAPGWDGNDYAP